MSHGYQINREDGTEQLGLDNTTFRYLFHETFGLYDTETRQTPGIETTLYTLSFMPHAAQTQGPTGDARYVVNVYDFPTITVQEYGEISVIASPGDQGTGNGDYTAIISEYG